MYEYEEDDKLREQISSLIYDLNEARLEIDRHHKALAEISGLCDAGLKNVFSKGLPTPDMALKEIRNITG